MEFDQFEPWRTRLAEAFEQRPDVEITKFSEDLGKNKDYISRLIKKGTAKPDPTLLLEICERLGVSAGFIIAGDATSHERDQVVRRVLDADLATIRRVSRALDLFEEDQ